MIPSGVWLPLREQIVRLKELRESAIMNDSPEMVRLEAAIVELEALLRRVH